jgi:hypothetical protein
VRFLPVLFFLLFLEEAEGFAEEILAHTRLLDREYSEARHRLSHVNTELP